MKKQSYSFWNLCAINLGSMIGVGIFFKNKGILEKTGNIWLALIAWVVGAILIYGVTLSFTEAHSYTGKNNISGTVPNWISTFIGPKTGRVAQQLFGWIYHPVFAALLVYYTVQFAYTGLGWSAEAIEANWKMVYLITTLGYIALTAGNAMSYSFGKNLQMIGTIIKFIPLFIVAVLGFVAPVESMATNTFANANTWNWGAISLAIPSVFFAFDGFASGIAFSKEEENKGDATKALLFSVIAVTVFYVIFAASVGFGTNNASLFKLFENTFGASGTRALYFLIAISAYTVANGQQLTSSRTMKAMADAKATIPMEVIKKVEADGRHVGQTWLNFAIGMLFMTVMFLTAEITGDKKGGTFDNFGNAITLFGFTFYALVSLGTFSNRFSSKFKVEKQKGLAFSFVSAVLMLWVIIQNTVKYFMVAVTYTSKVKHISLADSTTGKEEWLLVGREPTVMWLIVLTLALLFVTTKISELANKEMS